MQNCDSNRGFLMGMVVLYIAATVDGYIASKDGSIDWLHPFEQSGEDYGYAAFYARLGAVVVGGNTYRQALGFAQWPYPGMPTYVITSQAIPHPPDPSVRAYAGDVSILVAQIRQETGKDIWLVGGGQVITQFANRQLIDRYIISIIPIILGGGIPLFHDIAAPATLTLASSTSYPSGIVQLDYRMAQ